MQPRFPSAVILATEIDRLIERRDRALEQSAAIGDVRPGTLPGNFTG